MAYGAVRKVCKTGAQGRKKNEMSAERRGYCGYLKHATV